jgi:POT family proton-dependent oligopeptide transporter
MPDDPSEQARNAPLAPAGILGTIGIVVAIYALGRSGLLHVTPEGVGNAFGVDSSFVTVVFWTSLLGLRSWTHVERKRLLTILCLFLASVVFWSLFEQAGSTLNLFAERSTNNRAFGWSFPAAGSSRSARSSLS